MTWTLTLYLYILYIVSVFISDSFFFFISSLRLERKKVTANSNDEEDTTALVKDLRARVKRRKEQLADMEDVLPRKNDLYLTIILDGINVSFIDQEQRFRFKEAYEKFKLSVSAIIFFVAVLDFMVHYR